MHYLHSIIEFINQINWRDPKASLVLILLAIFALFKRWFLLLTTIFLIAFGQGQYYGKYNI